MVDIVRETTKRFPSDLARIVAEYACIPKMFAKDIARQNASDLIGWTCIDRWGYHMVYEACRAGHHEFAKRIAANHDLRRPMIYGLCRGGYVEELSVYSIRSDELTWALFHALRGGQTRVVLYLSDTYGCQLDRSEAMLGHACEGGSWDLMQATGFWSRTVSLRLAVVGTAKGGHTNLLNYILTKHRPLMLADIAMRHAAKRGHIGIVRLLLDKSPPDVSVLKRCHLAALDRGHDEIAAALAWKIYQENAE